LWGTQKSQYHSHMANHRIWRGKDGSKHCSCCKVIKPPTEYSKDRVQKVDGLKTICKPCALSIKRAWYRKSEKNRRRHLDKNKKWRTENREHYLSLRRARDKKIISDVTKWGELWRSNPIYRIKHKCRAMARNAVVLIKKGRELRPRYIHRLGIDAAEYKKYLEDRFKPGMTWSNYGNRPGKWCIDHIKPLSGFNLLDETQIKEASIRSFWPPRLPSARHR